MNKQTPAAIPPFINKSENVAATTPLPDIPEESPTPPKIVDDETVCD